MRGGVIESVVPKERILFFSIFYVKNGSKNCKRYGNNKCGLLAATQFKNMQIISNFVKIGFDLRSNVFNAYYLETGGLQVSPF